MTTGVSWRRLRQLVKSRDKSVCFYCDKVDENGHCDHIIPLSKGGTDEITNLVWSCAECNMKKGNKIMMGKINFFDRNESNKVDYKVAIRNDIVGKLLVMILSWFIPPYPEYRDFEFADREHYWNVIKSMKSQRFTSWLRELIWITPESANDVLRWIETTERLKRYPLVITGLPPEEEYDFQSELTEFFKD